MGRGNSDAIYFLEQHEQEIINCCRKGMSNNEVRQLLKTKYDREVADSTYRKFKAKLNLTKNDFLETMLDEIIAMKTSGATDASVRRWLAEETNAHQDNIDMAIDTILQQQVTDIKTGLENLDKITKNAVGIEIDFEKLEREVRHNSNEKSLPRYLLDLEELKIRYLELSVKAFEAKNKLFKDEMDRLFKNRVLELEDKRIEMSQKDIMNEIEVLAKQIDDNNV